MYRCMCKYVCLEIKKERELLGEGKGVVCLQEGAGTEFCEQGKKKKSKGTKGRRRGSRYLAGTMADAAFWKICATSFSYLSKHHRVENEPFNTMLLTRIYIYIYI